MALHPSAKRRDHSHATRWVVGLMCGPSADGVDAALVEVQGRGLDLSLRVAACLTEPCPEPLQDQIRQAKEPAAMALITQFQAQIGQIAAQAVQKVIALAKIEPELVECVAWHGQTIWPATDHRSTQSFQLGVASVLAQRSGVSVVSGFREAGGARKLEPAPLAPIVDWLLLRRSEQPRLIAHLGGIIHLTYLAPDAGHEEVLSFDVGPGTIVLDCLTQELTRGKLRYDAGGRFAVQGRQIKSLLRHWANHPFLQHSPPKSASQREFGETFVRETLQLAARKGWAVRDLLCTATHFCAACLADAVTRFLPAAPVATPEHDRQRPFVSVGAKVIGPHWPTAPTRAVTAGHRAPSPTLVVATKQEPSTTPTRFSKSTGRATEHTHGEMIVSGGGVHNGLLLRAIAERLPQYRLLRCDRFGLPVDAKGAVTSAVLACMAVDAAISHLPSQREPVELKVLGHFTPGSLKNWRRLIDRMATP